MLDSESLNVSLEWVADRLYGISYKPHELSQFGERVNFHLRWSPITEEGDPAQTTHYRLMVLEITATVPWESEDPRRGQTLDLLKIGWEVELQTSLAVSASELPDPPAHVRQALAAIADTVNDLARRAGYEAPMGTDVIDSLMAASEHSDAALD